MNDDNNSQYFIPKFILDSPISPTSNYDNSNNNNDDGHNMVSDRLCYNIEGRTTIDLENDTSDIESFEDSSQVLNDYDDYMDENEKYEDNVELDWIELSDILEYQLSIYSPYIIFSVDAILTSLQLHYGNYYIYIYIYLNLYIYLHTNIYVYNIHQKIIIQITIIIIK